MGRWEGPWPANPASASNACNNTFMDGNPAGQSAALYQLARNLHLLFVALSIGLFMFRGALMVVESALLASKVLRILPHVIDTLLLASAVWLVVMLREYPFVHGWVTAKVLGVVVYIVLGSIALRRGSTRRMRLAALAGALATIAYIISVARFHDPFAWLA